MVKMSIEWAKNMMGMTLSDAEMERIPNPRFELACHITPKFEQLFGITGTIILGPLAGVLNKSTRNWPTIKGNMVKCGIGGIVLGMFTGPLVTHLLMKKEDEYKIWDRCYRIRHNRSQIRADQAYTVGFTGGAVTGYVTRTGALFGGLVGMIVAMMMAATYSNMNAQKSSATKSEN